MKDLKKGRYILNAPWHKYNAKEVEIIMKRKGISDSFKGKDIYHVAFEPDNEFKNENYDEEFLSEHFIKIEEIKCIIDISITPKYIIKKYKPIFKRLKKLTTNTNVIFVERNVNDHSVIETDFLFVFYLIPDDDGNPCLSFINNGEHMIFSLI